MKRRQNPRKQSAIPGISSGHGPKTGSVRGGNHATTTDPEAGNKAASAYISALPSWKRAFATRFDELVEREIPTVRRAVKWTIPVYGIEGKGWFASFSAFKSHVKITFFHGSAFKPPLPGGRGQEMGFLDLTERDHLDERLVSSWIKQAATGRGVGS